MDHHDIVMPARLQSERARKLLKVIYDCTDAAGEKVGYYHGTYESLKTKRELQSKSGRVWSKEEVARERRRLVKLGLIRIYYLDDFGQSVECTTAATRKAGHLVAQRRIVITEKGTATLRHYYPKSVGAREAESPKTWWYPGVEYNQGTDQGIEQEPAQVTIQGTAQGTLLKGAEEQVQDQGAGEAALEKIKAELSEQTLPVFVAKFFEPLRAWVSGQQLILAATDEKHKQHLEARYLTWIRELLERDGLEPVVVLSAQTREAVAS